VSANGIRLHVAESPAVGSGPLVLMLHGFPEFWWAWRHQLAALPEAGYRAVAVDLRGYGDSDKPPRGYDGWTLAGDVAGLIKALGQRRAHLVGHGWGGMIAWTVAALHPRLVQSVTALAAPHPLALRRAVRRGLLRRRDSQARAINPILSAQWPIFPERALVADRAAAVERLVTRWAGAGWQTRESFREAVAANRAAMLVPGVAHSSLEYVRWAVRSQARSDGRRFAEAVDLRLSMPALQIQGEVDPCVLEATALSSREWLGAGARYRRLTGVGHFPHQEAPTTTSELILEFLGQFD
jgi:pimeloyl-ACP methyl ester carboxylesterase